MHLQLNHSGGTIEVLQLTDTHLGARADACLAGVNTAHSLNCVLEASAQTDTCDLVLLTGDLADDGSAEAYQRLDRMLASGGVPQAWLPGNHDDLPQMLAVAPQRVVQTVSIGAWGIILLNSQIPGEVGGELADSELERLVAFLDAPAYEHVLVCVHHHPVPIGSAWLDQQLISNADRLLSLIGNSKVRALLWGHVHQVCDSRRGALRLLGSPSTCVQFSPGSDRFRVDEAGPGCRRLWLAADGSIETQVERIDPRLINVDFECGGY